jgi:serine/threonine protein kinase
MLKTVQNIDIKIPGLKIIRKIGEGGMSVVYLAEQVSLKREVAVKVMRLEIASNDLDVQRFKHEAKTIAQLDHPNIINIYNIGQTSKGEIFFTMPYLNHGDFSSYILEDENEFVKLLKSICDGLSFAHERGVVHRDIKPENLLFDEFGNVRIADFGIAISKDGTRMTKEHQIVGSAQYMSPEQARSLKVDVHSDIYSLGIVIYERLTGQVPFNSEESISILVSHVSEEPPKLPVKMRHWQKVIDKCLAKAPKDRYQSMPELKQALDNVPLNSLQKTNNSIQELLDNDKGKHLKWFIPSLLILLIIAIFGINKSNNNSDVNKISTPTIKIVDNPVDVIQQTVTNTDTSPNMGPDNSLSNTKYSTVVNSDGFEEQTHTSDISSGITEVNTNELTIEEIKDKMHQEFPDTVIKNTAETSTNSEVELLLSQAQANVKKYQLLRPTNDNATDQYLKILTIEPNNSKALEGLQIVGRKYYQLVNSALSKKDYDTALKHSISMIDFSNKSKWLNNKFSIQKKSLIDKIAEINVKSTLFPINDIKKLKQIVTLLSPNSSLLSDFDAVVRSKMGPQIGDKLLDQAGIETVLVSKNLAVSTNEITVEQYREFADSVHRPPSKCRHMGGGMSSLFNSKNWKKPYFPQTSNHPVVCVSQLDAQAYAQWLTDQTNKQYRLPTKKEFLLMATQDKNNFTPCQTANVTGQEASKIRNKEDKYSCNDGYKFTAPIGSFTANQWGIYDIQGNVSEWIACKYSACQSPIAMGSSWYNGKITNTLDYSKNYKQSVGYSYIGFRLVRDL